MSGNGTIGLQAKFHREIFRQPTWISESVPSVVVSEILRTCVFHLFQLSLGGFNLGTSDPVFPNGKASLVKVTCPNYEIYQKLTSVPQ